MTDNLNATSRWLVVATRTPWDETPRIRHQVARGLSKYYSILYIHFPTDWRRKHRGRWRNVEPGIVVWEPSNVLSAPDPVVARCSWSFALERLYLRSVLARWLQKLSLPPIALINFDHRHDWIQDHNLFKRIIYLCNDDFPEQLATAGRSQLAEWTSRKIRKAACSADVALATSEHIAREVMGNGRVKIFSPGHDLPMIDRSPVRPYRSGEKLRIGFMGYIDHRLGAKWVALVANQPDIEWHMIGPVKDQGIRAELLSYGVKLYDTQVGPSLLEWLRGMDVLTMPYVLTSRLANAGMPNKLYAYLAAGRPVVASAQLPIPDFGPGIVYRASNAQEFAAQVRRARLEDDNAKAVKRLEIASENTWDKRIVQLRQLIEGNDA